MNIETVSPVPHAVPAWTDRAPYNGPKYLTCAETARLIRAALKARFPGQKFSVRSSNYSGGASINVHWTSGPTEKEVGTVTEGFVGGGFDGMIDMKYNISSWLLPDGTATWAKSPGTQGSMGLDPAFDNPKPHPDAIWVDFASDHVFLRRDPTPGAPPPHDCFAHLSVRSWDGWACDICALYAEPIVRGADGKDIRAVEHEETEEERQAWLAENGPPDPSIEVIGDTGGIS